RVLRGLHEHPVAEPEHLDGGDVAGVIARDGGVGTRYRRVGAVGGTGVDVDSVDPVAVVRAPGLDLTKDPRDLVAWPERIVEPVPHLTQRYFAAAGVHP